MKSVVASMIFCMFSSICIYAAAAENGQKQELPLPPNDQLRTQSTPKNLSDALKHSYIAAYTSVESIPEGTCAPPTKHWLGEFTPTTFVQDLRLNAEMPNSAIDIHTNRYYCLEPDFPPGLAWMGPPPPPALFMIDLASGQRQRIAKCPWKERSSNATYDGHKIFGFGRAFPREGKELLYSYDLWTKTWQLLHEKPIEAWLMGCPFVACTDDKVIALYTFEKKEQVPPNREHPRLFPVHTYRLDSYSKSGQLMQSKVITKDGEPLVERGGSQLISLGGNYLVLQVAPPMPWEGIGFGYFDSRENPLYKPTKEKVRLRTYVINSQTAQVLATNQIEMPYYSYADTGQEGKP